MTNVSSELLINCQSTQETFKVKITYTETTTRLSTVMSTVDSTHHDTHFEKRLIILADSLGSAHK